MDSKLFQKTIKQFFVIILMNLFFKSQFNYCPLIWICHGRTNNRKINKLHERCLRIIQNENQSLFMKLLGKYNSVSIHQRNLQILATGIYKVNKDLLLPLMRDIFNLRSEQTYNLRKSSQFFTPPVNSVYHGTKSVLFLGSKVLDLIPKELKSISNLAALNKTIKKWSPGKYPCRLCKIYVSKVVFI